MFSGFTTNDLWHLYSPAIFVLQLLIIDHRTQFALLLYEELPYEPLEMFQNRESYEKELV